LTAIDVREKFDDGEFRATICFAANVNCGATNYLSAIKLVPLSSVVVRKLGECTNILCWASPGDVFAKRCHCRQKGPRAQNDRIRSHFAQYFLTTHVGLQNLDCKTSKFVCASQTKVSVGFPLDSLSESNFVDFLELLSYKFRRM
jgi:hypothetical protein